MGKSKLWKIRGQDVTLSDGELIELIKQGKIKKSTMVTTKDMKTWVCLGDSIYQYYFKEDENETLQ